MDRWIVLALKAPCSTSLTSEPRQPNRLIFAEQAIASVFCPAVADLQEELREAGASRIRQLAVRCRWCWALFVLVFTVPLSVPISPVSGRAPALLPAGNGGWLFVLLATALYAGTWEFANSISRR